MPVKLLASIVFVSYTCSAYASMESFDQKVTKLLREEYGRFIAKPLTERDALVRKEISFRGITWALRSEVSRLGSFKDAFEKVLDQFEIKLEMLDRNSFTHKEIFFAYGAASAYKQIGDELINNALSDLSSSAKTSFMRHESVRELFEKWQALTKKLRKESHYSRCDKVHQRREELRAARKAERDQIDAENRRWMAKIARIYHSFSEVELRGQIEASRFFVGHYKEVKANLEHTSERFLDERWENLRVLWYSYLHFRKELKIDPSYTWLMVENENATSDNVAYDLRFMQLVKAMRLEAEDLVSDLNEAILTVESNLQIRDLPDIIRQEAGLAKIIAPYAETLIQVYSEHPKFFIASKEQNRKLLRAYLSYSEAVQEVALKSGWAHPFFGELQQLRSPNDELIHLSSKENSDNEERLIRILVYAGVAPFGTKGADGFPVVNEKAVFQLLNATRAVEAGGLSFYHYVSFLGQTLFKPTCFTGTHAITIFETPYRGLGARLGAAD